MPKMNSGSNTRTTNHRISEETRAKLSDAGKKGAEARWGTKSSK